MTDILIGRIKFNNCRHFGKIKFEDQAKIEIILPQDNEYLRGSRS
jgi:hypothetical protein